MKSLISPSLSFVASFSFSFYAILIYCICFCSCSYIKPCFLVFKTVSIYLTNFVFTIWGISIQIFHSTKFLYDFRTYFLFLINANGPGMQKSEWGDSFIPLGSQFAQFEGVLWDDLLISHFFRKVVRFHRVIRIAQFRKGLSKIKNPLDSIILEKVKDGKK